MPHAPATMITEIVDRTIHQISGQAIGGFLNGSPRFLGVLDGLNNLPEGGVAPKLVGADFEGSRLIHGAGIKRVSGQLFNRHRFARDGRLVHKRPACRNQPIHRNSSARFDDHGVADPDLVGGDFDYFTISTDRDCSGQKIEKVLNGPPSAPDRETLENLGSQHENCNHQGGKEFSDHQRRKQGDGHRQLHRHLALDDVFKGFMKNGIAANQGRQNADHADVRKGLPNLKPDGRRRQRHKRDSRQLKPFDTMLVGWFRVGSMFGTVGMWRLPPAG
jgi:hypothetical protein